MREEHLARDCEDCPCMGDAGSYVPEDECNFGYDSTFRKIPTDSGKNLWKQCSLNCQLKEVKHGDETYYPPHPNIAVSRKDYLKWEKWEKRQRHRQQFNTY